MIKCWLWVLLPLAIAPLEAQDPVPTAAAAQAAKQESEERYRRLTADVEALQAANVALQKRLGAAIDEIEKLREDLSRAGGKYATQEEIKFLTEKLREMDKKRESDNEQILNTLKKLASAPAPVPTIKPDKPDKPERTERNSNSGQQTSEQGYWYVIQENDRLESIVRRYKENGVNVTVKQMLDANPKLKPNRLLVGSRIWVPASDSHP